MLGGSCQLLFQIRLSKNIEIKTSIPEGNNPQRVMVSEKCNTMYLDLVDGNRGNGLHYQWKSCPD